MKSCPALPRHSVSYKWNGKEATRHSSETGQSIFQEWKRQNLPQVCFGDMSHGVNLRHRRTRLGRRRRRCGGERWEGEASWCSTIYPPLCHVFAQQKYHKRCDLLLVLITCLSKTRSSSQHRGPRPTEPATEPDRTSRGGRVQAGNHQRPCRYRHFDPSSSFYTVIKNCD